MATNYLEELSTPEVLAFLFAHQATRRKLVTDAGLTPAAIEAWAEFQAMFRRRLENLPEEKQRYLLCFSYPQSTEEIDPYDQDEVARLRERLAPVVRQLLERTSAAAGGDGR